MESPEPARVRLHLVNYRAWRASVYGFAVAAETDPQSGQMVIPVARGYSDVRVWFGHTADRTAGPIVSVIALGLLAVLWIAVLDTGTRRRPGIEK